ncbi:unnamed protein product [Wickerhamomyces anomalus]
MSGANVDPNRVEKTIKNEVEEKFEDTHPSNEDPEQSIKKEEGEVYILGHEIDYPGFDRNEQITLELLADTINDTIKYQIEDTTRNLEDNGLDNDLRRDAYIRRIKALEAIKIKVLSNPYTLSCTVDINEPINSEAYQTTMKSIEGDIDEFLLKTSFRASKSTMFSVFGGPGYEELRNYELMNSIETYRGLSWNYT